MLRTRVKSFAVHENSRGSDRYRHKSIRRTRQGWMLGEHIFMIYCKREFNQKIGTHPFVCRVHRVPATRYIRQTGPQMVNVLMKNGSIYTGISRLNMC